MHKYALSNLLRSFTAFFIAAALLLPLFLTSCGTHNTSQTVSTDNQEEIINITADFFKELSNADKIAVSSYNGYELNFKYAKQGDRFYYFDNETDLESYYYKDNSGKKYRVEFESAYPDDKGYDRYSNLIADLVKTYVTDLVNIDTAGGNFVFSGTKKDETAGNNKSSSLSVSITGEKGGLSTKIKIEAIADNEGRVTKLISSFEDDTQKQTSEFRFSYDNIKVDLPDSFNV